jgi:hypothetical protein
VAGNVVAHRRGLSNARALTRHPRAGRCQRSGRHVPVRPRSATFCSEVRFDLKRLSPVQAPLKLSRAPLMRRTA